MTALRKLSLLALGATHGAEARALAADPDLASVSNRYRVRTDCDLRLVLHGPPLWSPRMIVPQGIILVVCHAAAGAIPTVTGGIGSAHPSPRPSRPSADEVMKAVEPYDARQN